MNKQDICRLTKRQPLPLVPEISLYLASDDLPIWQMGEAELEAQGLNAPFWAFAWAGGQALSRFILDHPEHVKAKRVLDFGAGSGIVAIAAMMAGATEADASEIDPDCVPAMEVNAKANGVTIKPLLEDVTDGPADRWDVILVGDVCYEGPMAQKIMTWLRKAAGQGVPVLMGDPGRSYTPKQGLEKLIAYGVKTDSQLEDTDLRNTVVWKVLPDG